MPMLNTSSGCIAKSGSVRPMPQVGDVSSARKLGYRTNCVYIWYACARCGEERWVRRKEVVKANYRRLCPICARRKRAEEHYKQVGYDIWNGKGQPKVGQAIYSRHIGFKSRSIMFWDVCPRCGLGRWVQKHNRGCQCKTCRSQLHGATLTGDKNPHWKGGRAEDGAYIRVQTKPDNPFYSMASKAGYVAEHRLVMAQHLGRSLHRWEIVHHINRDKKDNRLENLRLLPSALEHAPFTKMEERIGQLEQQIGTLQSRVTLLEAENSLLKNWLEVRSE